VVVFDVETTTLIDEHTRVEDMEVSVACAMRLPTAATRETTWAAAEHGVFWHKDARGVNGSTVARLLEWFDAADAIVAYNGRAFDMRVLEKVYDGDDERAQSHMAKLMDPMDVVQRACGRRVRLSHQLALNGAGKKAGCGCDAPRLWERGQMEQLERYCRRDTEALAELVLRESMRIPGGATSEASVARRLRAAHAEAEREGDDADTEGGGGTGDTDERRRRPRDEGNGGSSAGDAMRAYESNRPKRQRKTPVPTYDEVVRRRPRRKRNLVQYVERGKMARGAGGKRIEVGPLTIDRTVAQRYEWRDAQLQKRRRTRAHAPTTVTRVMQRQENSDDAVRTVKMRRRRDPG